MLSVALTGNVASGKSAVGETWAREGVPVVSADELARRAVAPGSEALQKVRRTFGEEVMASDGTLDRDALRRRVFQDDDARGRLESIVHPRVWALWESWLRERAAEDHALVAAEIPLLYETGRQHDFDVVVVVDAPEAERLRRLVELRGLDEAEARRIMASQMGPAEKRRKADHVLVNDGSLESLEARARALLETLRRDGPADGGVVSGAGAPFLRVDFHMHTRASFDCLCDPEAMLAAARSRGVARIAITDHNRLGVALEMAARHPDAVIPGEEVKTAEGIDVIGLYLREEIPRGTPAEEVCRIVKEQGGVSYLPHPYAAGKGGGGRYAEALAPLVDVVEVFNARLHAPRMNAAAAELAERHGALRGAGSDAHTVGEVAGAWVELPPHPNEPAALLEALREGRVHGETAPRRVHLASTWAKVRKRLPF
ncbi:MAG: dephospho-CoA kinase [Gemmatimonadetes bacterium]|nr:dephospho-CoA kinase [Gemmatimonadota bacterium]